MSLKDPVVDQQSRERLESELAQARATIASLEQENSELRVHSEFLRVAEECVEVGTWDWDFATNAVRWSAGMYRVMGVELGEFAGTPESASTFFHPEDRGRVEAAIRRGIEELLPNEREEYRILRPNGAVRHVWGHGEILRNEDGIPYRMIGTVLDVTERKRAEAAIADAQERLRLALAAGRVGTWELNARTNQVTFSREIFELYRLRPGNFDGNLETVISFVYPEDLPAVLAKVDLAMESPDAPDYEMEHRVIDQEDHVHWVLAQGRVFHDASGVPQKMAGTLVDITERKQLESDLRDAQRLESIGRLAGGIAHDFNNLLTVIFGAVSLAKQYTSSDLLLENLEAVQSASDQAARLTQQLLAFGRRQVVQPGAIEVNELVRNVEALLQRTLGEDIELRAKLDAGLWPVHADRGQFEQVLMNLAVNARQAMPAGGTLTIATSNVVLPSPSDRNGSGATREFVRLSVTDTGLGMDDETQNNIFEPFFTTKTGGHGLGLASTYGIVSQAGGSISVESGPDAGTTFFVDLPRSTREPVPAPATDRSPFPSTEGSETVLVVEDEPPVRELLIRSLELQGYQVLSACDGAEAVELFESCDRTIDVLVTDAVMPRMSGPELASRVRESYPACRILLISGYAGDLQEAVQDEIHFLQKPFSPLTLIRAIRDLINSSDERRG